MLKEEKPQEKAAVYSHSRLSLYESCPEAFKVKYIDKEFPDMPRSVSLFLGGLVHESLEWLYEEVSKNNSVELDELIRHFVENWHKQVDNEIRTFNGERLEDNLNKGVKYLIDYYKKHFPFRENTFAIEKKVLFPLDEQKNYWIQGFIDRIVKVGNDHFEVHDYKTNQTMKTQTEIDKDRQLAFYHLGLQHIFGANIKVDLVWHFLAHNQKITSKRDNEQLFSLKQETLQLIHKINTTKEWPSCGRRWCDWCSWKKDNDFAEYKAQKKRFGNSSLGNFM